MTDLNKVKLNRRDFLVRAGGVGGLVLTIPWSGCAQPHADADVVSGPSQEVAIVVDPNDPVATSIPARWAVGELVAALAEQKIASKIFVRVNQTAATLCIVAGGPSIATGKLALPDVPESLSFNTTSNEKQVVVYASGRDATGLVYALTELADRVRHASNPFESLRSLNNFTEQPANRVRGVMRLFDTDVEDKSWFNDESFWHGYLTMLVGQRFNRFDLALGLGYDTFGHVRDSYFLFAYPFLVSVPGYDVKAVGLPDAERDQNLKMLKFISDESARRGLPFHLGLWTHAYEWTDSPNVNYVIEGLDRARHAEYCRDALHQILTACPSIAGVTFRVHGESGVTEGSYDFWKTVFDGVVRTGRPIEINLHAKGLDDKLIDIAVATKQPLSISPKFWAEHIGLPYHQARIRDLEMPTTRPGTGLFALSNGSRSFLRYGYGDLFRKDRKYRIIHRIWPGTQRLLAWGDPKFAAEYGKCFKFNGGDGVQMFDPLGFKGREGSGLPNGRTLYADASLNPEHGDWEKFTLLYRLWGRMSYNPDTDPDVCTRPSRKALGDAAPTLLSALARSGRILPLITTAHDPSAANAAYWPEMYTNMSIVDPAHPGPYGDTPRPRVFGNVSPLDPQLFSTINEYCASLLNERAIAKISPLQVAMQLDDWASAATKDLANAGAAIGAEARRLSIDTAIAADLGRFFAWKFRAAVLFGIFDRSGVERARQQALIAYRKARDVWAGLAQRATGVYVSDLTFGPSRNLRGHWNDRLPAIDQDITAMENYRRRGNAIAEGPAELVEQCIAIVNGRIRFGRPSVEHTPPTSFRPGKPIAITLPRPTSVSSVRLWYRRVNQAERWVDAGGVTPDGSVFTAVIPGEYTNTPYAIQYYFELHGGAGSAWLYPGFGGDFCGQPYYLVSQ